VGLVAFRIPVRASVSVLGVAFEVLDWGIFSDRRAPVFWAFSVLGF